MKYVQIKLTWDKNKDYRVTELMLTIFMIGKEEPIGQLSLPPDANFAMISVQDNSSYNINIVALTADDKNSETSFTFDIPDLDQPIPVSGMNWEVVKVMDEEELIELLKESQTESETKEENNE